MTNKDQIVTVEVTDTNGSTFTLRLALLNPAGEEVQLPQFSNAEYTLSVLSEAEAEEHAAKGPGLSIERSGK